MPPRVSYTNVPFDYVEHDIQSEEYGRVKDKPRIKPPIRYSRGFQMNGYQKHETREENENIGHSHSYPSNISRKTKSLYKHDGSYNQHVDGYSNYCKDGGADEQSGADVMSRIYDILWVKRRLLITVALHLGIDFCILVQHFV